MDGEQGEGRGGVRRRLWYLRDTKESRRNFVFCENSANCLEYIPGETWGVGCGVTQGRRSAEGTPFAAATTPSSVAAFALRLGGLLICGRPSPFSFVGVRRGKALNLCAVVAQESEREEGRGGSDRVVGEETMCRVKIRCTQRSSSSRGGGGGGNGLGEGVGRAQMGRRLAQVIRAPLYLLWMYFFYLEI